MTSSGSWLRMHSSNCAPAPPLPSSGLRPVILSIVLSSVARGDDVAMWTRAAVIQRCLKAGWTLSTARQQNSCWQGARPTRSMPSTRFASLNQRGESRGSAGGRVRPAQLRIGLWKVQSWCD
eukprot:3518919-Rhodomonas_salina.3